jgi:hypothetical protein
MQFGEGCEVTVDSAVSAEDGDGIGLIRRLGQANGPGGSCIFAKGIY